MRMQSLSHPTGSNPERNDARPLVKNNTNEQVGQSARMQTAVEVTHSLVKINADANPQ